MHWLTLWVDFGSGGKEEIQSENCCGLYHGSLKFSKVRHYASGTSFATDDLLKTYLFSVHFELKTA
jgi:hypothetical protein